MPKMSKALPVITGLVVLLLLVGVACTGTGRRAARTTPTPTSQRTPVAQPTPRLTPTPTLADQQPTGAPRRGGTFIRLGNDPPTLDPHLATDADSATYLVEVYDSLVTIDPDLKVVPDLAKSWDVSGNGKVYTFHIDERARFHNGKKVTAQDVKWSLERALDPNTQSPVVDQYLNDIVGSEDKLKGLAKDVRGVRAIDERTAEISIDAPKSYFLAKMTYPTAFVLDRENVESSRRWFLKPNATGPFVLGEYVPGERLILKRNDSFHLGAPFLDEVRFILSGGTAMLMYENNEIHVTGVGLADLDRVLDPSNPLSKQVQRTPPSFSTSYIGLNVTKPPLDDPKIRQALNLAINRAEIARQVLADLVVPAKGILPPGFPGYNPNLSGYEYNLDKAKQLVKESKYGQSGSIPRIVLTTPGGFGAAQVGLDLEVILEQWKQLGLQIEIQQTDFATFLQDLHRRRLQAFDIGWIADYPDPQNFLDILFHSKSTGNNTGYSNPEVDRLLEQARTEVDQQKRYELYRQAEVIILRDAPWVPLWHGGENYVLIKPQVKNYYLLPLIAPRMRYVYLEK